MITKLLTKVCGVDVLKALSVSAPAREFDGAGEKRLAGGKPEGAAERDFASRVLELRQERANRKEAGSEKPGRLEKHARREGVQEELSAQAGAAEITALEAAPIMDEAAITPPSGEAVDGLIDAVPAPPADTSLAADADGESSAGEESAVSAKAEAIIPLTEESAAPLIVKGEPPVSNADRTPAPPAAPKTTPETSDVRRTPGALETARPVPAAGQAAAAPPDGEKLADDAPPLRGAPSELKPAADAAVQSSPPAPKTAAPVPNAGIAAPVEDAEQPLEAIELEKASPEEVIAKGEVASAPKKEALMVTPAGVKLALDAQAAPLAPSERPLQAETTLQTESAKPQAPAAQTKVDAPEAARQVFASIRADKGGGVDLRLDPPDLGRVRIQFSFERSDVVVATVSSERGETLDLMRRHAGDLARELQRAGFESVTLEFASGESKQSPSRDLSRGGAYDFSGDAMDAPSIVYISARADNRLDRLV